MRHPVHGQISATRYLRNLSAPSSARVRRVPKSLGPPSQHAKLLIGPKLVLVFGCTNSTVTVLVLHHSAAMMDGESFWLVADL